jgi:cob(I)alamin adenosyltransferase
MVIASRQMGADGGELRDKDSPYMHAMGEVDRLNCLLGLLNSKLDFPDLRDLVESVQRDLLDLSAELSHPARFVVNESAVAHLSHHTRRLSATLPPLDAHAVPGGTEAAALCHYSWATCRSVERTLLRLDDIDPAPGAVRLSYVDKLSELLFVLARTLNARADTRTVR